MGQLTGGQTINAMHKLQTAGAQIESTQTAITDAIAAHGDTEMGNFSVTISAMRLRELVNRLELARRHAQSVKDLLDLSNGGKPCSPEPEVRPDESAGEVPGFAHSFVQYLHTACFGSIAPIKTGYDPEHDDMTEVTQTQIVNAKSTTLAEHCARCGDGFHLAEHVICYVYRYND